MQIKWHKNVCKWWSIFTKEIFGPITDLSILLLKDVSVNLLKLEWLLPTFWSLLLNLLRKYKMTVMMRNLSTLRILKLWRELQRTLTRRKRNCRNKRRKLWRSCRRDKSNHVVRILCQLMLSTILRTLQKNCSISLPKRTTNSNIN